MAARVGELHEPVVRAALRPGRGRPVNDLPENARARHDHPDTSHEAAASVGPLNESQQAVLGLFELFGPMHDELLIVRYPRRVAGPHQTDQSIRSRRKELERAGLVTWTGDYAKTRSGRRSRVHAVPVV